MRSSQLLHLAISSMAIAVIIVFFIMIIYFFIQKKQKKQINLKNRKLFFISIFIIYLIVILIATLINRPNYSFNQRASFQLFSSYRYAIHNFDLREWRNIILNICMTIPLGILLPLINKKFKNWWLTYLAGLAFTTIIELTQLLTNRGIFEIDDIFNNTLGCTIGFGIYKFLSYFYQKLKKKKTNIKYTAIFQIPLLLTVFSFSSIFISYYQQELGNLPQSYYKIIDMSNIKISNQIKFSNQSNQKYVYKIKRYTQEQCYQAVKPFFNNKHLVIDDQQTHKDDETIYFYDKDNKMSASVQYNGKIISLHYNNENDNGKAGLSFEKVKNIIETTGIDIPDNAKITDLNDGNYEISVDYILNKTYFHGVINCKINSDENLIRLDNHLKNYETYKKYPIISQAEAFSLLKEGKFNPDWLTNLKNEITIKNLKLIYLEDTKGFYQPVYQFSLGDGEIIYIPALKK